jgi:hypothetical protein
MKRSSHGLQHNFPGRNEINHKILSEDYLLSELMFKLPSNGYKSLQLARLVEKTYYDYYSAYLCSAV